MPKIPSRQEPRAVVWTTWDVTVLLREVGAGEGGELEVGPDRSRTVPAQVYGKLAVHQSIDQSGYWAVTSITTKLQCCVVDAERDAKLIAEELWRRFPAAFRLTNVDEMRDALPKWVAKWLRACAEKGKYLKIKSAPKGV